MYANQLPIKTAVILFEMGVQDQAYYVKKIPFSVIFNHICNATDTDLYSVQLQKPSHAIHRMTFIWKYYLDIDI